REEQLRRWQQALEGESRRLDATRDTLTAIRQEWEATEESATEQELPEAMVGTIRQILDNVAEADEELTVWRDDILTILSRVSQAATQVTQAKARVEQASAIARRSILVPESQPLWKAWAARADSVTPGEHLRSEWDRNTEQMAEFFATRVQQLLAQFGLFVVLVALMFAIRRSGRAWEDDEEMKASFHILSRPIAVAMALTLLCTRLFLPRAPAVVFDLTAMLWLIPTLRLLPGILQPAMRLPAYGLMGLFALAEIEDLVSGFAITSRLVLLVVTMLALAGIVFTIRSGHGVRLPGTGKWHNIMIFAARLAAIVLGISVAANILGFVRLASLLTRGTLTSGFAALIALVLVEVIAGVIRALLRHGPVEWLQSVRMSYGNLTRRMEFLVKLGIACLWLYASLQAFNIADVVWTSLTAVLGRQWEVGSWAISLADIIAFVLTLWLALWISQIVRALLKEDVLPRMQLGRGVPETISTVAHYIV
ncbi:MAG: hypothetical protein JSW51_05455, partial [Gemmatimonadota bacterium]